MDHSFPVDRANAIETAQKYISSDPLFLDTETTGLNPDDEICEIAIVDIAGNVLINSLVKPAHIVIPPGATAVHSITNEMVASAPKFVDVWPELHSILKGRTVVIYNAEYDKKMLWSSARHNGMEFTEDGQRHWWGLNHKDSAGQLYSSWHCAMELYAEYYGDWNDYHQSYRWQRLSTAARQCNIELPADIHRAHVDVEMTRQIVLHVAAGGASQLQMFE
jgi:DNA polymerase III subunit epsilon